MRALPRTRKRNRLSAAPSTVSTTPVTSPTVRLSTRLANRAETREAAIATVIHRSSTGQRSSKMAGWMRIWLTEAMSAVEVMIKVLVPTADFNSMPRNAVNTTSIIIPPPEPTKPVPKPIVRPKKSETATPFQSNVEPLPTDCSRSVVGLTRNRMPMQKVRMSVKPPSTMFPAFHAAKLPRVHIPMMQTSMIHPRRRSMFLCLM